MSQNPHEVYILRGDFYAYSLLLFLLYCWSLSEQFLLRRKICACQNFKTWAKKKNGLGTPLNLYAQSVSSVWPCRKSSFSKPYELGYENISSGKYLEGNRYKEPCAMCSIRGTMFSVNNRTEMARIMIPKNLRSK